MQAQKRKEVTSKNASSPLHLVTSPLCHLQNGGASPRFHQSAASCLSFFLAFLLFLLLSRLSFGSRSIESSENGVVPEPPPPSFALPPPPPPASLSSSSWP